MSDNPFIKSGPEITDVETYEPVTNADGRLSSVVILERIEPGVTPEYCVHGRATCFRCREWCWLGDETHRVVKERRATPLCIECANEVIPRTHQPVSHVQDHRRADGPH